MELSLVSHGIKPICAFVSRQKGADFHPDRSARTLKGEKIDLRTEGLTAVMGFNIGKRNADDGYLKHDKGKVLVCFSRGKQVSVTRILNHARSEVMAPNIGDHGDVFAAILAHPEAENPRCPRAEFASTFGPYWPMTMHEKWRKHLKCFEQET